MNFKMSTVFRIISTKEAKRYVASWAYIKFLPKSYIYVIKKAIFDNQNFPLSKFMTKHCTIAKKARFSKIFDIMTFMAISYAIFTNSISFTWKTI